MSNLLFVSTKLIDLRYRTEFIDFNFGQRKLLTYIKEQSTKMEAKEIQSAFD